MEAIGAIIILAIIIEGVVQAIKGTVPEGAKVPAWTWGVVAAVLGIALCLLAGVDLLTVAGITLAAPFVGQILTGVIISRGASFVHDLWAKIRGDWQKDKPPDGDQ